MSTDHMFIGKRGEYIIGWGKDSSHMLTMRDIYKFVHDRLENAHGTVTDIDALCQQVCVETEKKLGIFPNVPPADQRPAEAVSKTTLDKLRDVHSVAGAKGNVDANDYMRGMFNGLELALAIAEDRDPNYAEAPDA